MELQEVIEKAKDIKKGAFVRIEYYANPYTLAAGRDKNIVKKCKGVYRLGLNYSHLKANINKETGGLNGKVESVIILFRNAPNRKGFISDFDKNSEILMRFIPQLAPNFFLLYQINKIFSTLFGCQINYFI